MPFIEIITDTKSQIQLNKSIKKEQVNNCEILYIKEKNIDNIKNIKLETLVINKKIEDMEKISKIIENTKNVIINLDFNKIEKQNKFISYGYNSKSDITISSIDEDEALIYIQKEITSIFGRKIEPQEVKVKLKSDINIYNIMIIIALNVLYTR
ncbi:MAG: hypothetical protein U0O43_03730 [Clostridia bacterium]|jgi:UDP-N-acetylmuramyl tripeptide synthase